MSGCVGGGGGNRGSSADVSSDLRLGVDCIVVVVVVVVVVVRCVGVVVDEHQKKRVIAHLCK
jgi:hypothetical protein